MKINVNEVTTKDLKKIKGIGDSTAKKILDFREKGGRINNIDEFKKITGLRSDYLKDIEEKVSFNGAGIGSQTNGDSRLSIPGLGGQLFKPTPVSSSYTFTIQLTGIPEDNGPNPFAGYKMIVGYSVSNPVLNFNRTKNYSQSYNISSDGKVKVSLGGQNFLRAWMIHKTMDIIINAPDGSTIYNSTFEVESDDIVDVHVPRFADNVFIVALEKIRTISYEGYSLRVNYRINRDNGGIETKREEFDIATRDEFRIEAGHFGEVLDVDIIILSEHGLSLIREQKKWGEIPETSGLKKMNFALPEPRSLSFNAILVVDPEELQNPYVDHSLSISYGLKDPETGEPVRNIKESYNIDPTGTAHIEFEHYGLIEEMSARVSAPSGEIIGKKTLAPVDIGADGEIQINVPPRKLASLDGMETLPERPQNTAGRVIDAMGQRNYEDIQVIIYATKAENPSDDDFVPLLVIKTEGKGYFSFNTPKGYYSDAFARVGVKKRGEIDPEPKDVPIRLEKDTVVIIREEERSTEQKMFFPANIILVVGEAMGEEEKEPENECGFLEFHKARRIVDEFSFYTVVRTTEPDIQGYTLEEDGEMTVQKIVETVSISQDKNEDKQADIPSHYLQKSIRNNVLMKYINDKRGLTFTTLKKALNESNAQKLREQVKSQRQERAKGRHRLNLDNAIDWDEAPTIYQTTSIAHGQLLQFKQEWINDGYSIGDLLYSLPLAPGQKKQIVTFDWERREAAGRMGSREYQEGLYNSLTRDRDVNEITTGTLKESMRGSSTAKTSAFGAGLGIGGIAKGVGGLLGIAGGASKSSSSAWQKSSRHTTLTNIQQLRDKTVQSAHAVRSQRSTVVATATQGERFSAETESVANYNHCHSITIQYFEVLRHLKVRQRLASVQECLFVPLILSPFDHHKILRWREAIAPFIFDNRLENGFKAIERIENNYEGSDLPDERYADDNIRYLEGDMNLKFQIIPPHQLTSIEDDAGKVEKVMNDLFGWIPGVTEHIRKIVQADLERRNELFFENIAPQLAAAFIEFIEFEAVVARGQDGDESTTVLPLDTTLVSRFKNNVELYVSIRQNGGMPGIKRADIKSITMRKASHIQLSNGKFLSEAMPENSRIIVTSGRMRYRTDHFSEDLFDKSRIMDDLVGYGAFRNQEENDPLVILPEGYGEDKVRIATPLNQEEMRNPRKKDLELANELMSHLNENLEQYHRTIWMNMSDERRFMLLDGIRITDYSESENYPAGVVRSVASVVENRVIGIVGNSLVMPVAPGFQLDPNIKGKDIDLLSLYESPTPEPPMNISIPTKGVYAESVMGKCNSCEKIQEDRFWRWSEEPIPQDPTAVQPVSTKSRRSEPLETKPHEFPQPMVNVQNAPQAPAPQGYGAAANLLGQSSFRDITGLERNQANAMKALQSSLSTAESFGKEASQLISLGKRLDAIKDAKRNNLLSEDKAKELSEETIKSFSDGTANELDSALSGMRKVQDMVNKGELPADAGKQIQDAISNGIGKSLGNGSQSLQDLISTGSEKIGEGKVKSMDAETTNMDGSSSKISLSGGDKLKYASSDLSIWEHRVNKWETWRNRIVQNAKDEESYWTKEDGTKKLEKNELDKLKEYYRAAGLNPDVSAPDNVINNEVPPGERQDPNRTYPELARDNYIPWSAAFISYVVKQAGVKESDGFDLGTRHMNYITQAMANRLNEDYEKPFWLYNVSEIDPSPGDILCKNRGEGHSFQYLKNNRVTKNSEDTYVVSNKTGKSHGDIVVKRYTKNGNTYIETIGGNTRDLGSNGQYNVVNTVGRKIWQLPKDSGGNIKMVNENLSDASSNVFNSSDDSVFAFVRIRKVGLAFSGSEDTAVG